MGDALVTALNEGRRQFLELVADIRPDLHRYCARMTGSVADGEDIVQDTLARAYYALSEAESVPPLRPWLFQIAHNRALDHLRRYDRRMGQPLDEIAERAAGGADPEDALARAEATGAAIARFTELAPAQRSCVILKDVLGHSLDEIASLTGLTIAAVKAALHRGRERLRALATAAPAAPPHPALLLRYVALFNARDWDGVRALLADDVRLELVARARRNGRREVEAYVTNYDAVHDWRLAPGWVDGRPVIVVERDGGPGYFVALTFRPGGITLIKDFRYVPYILDGAAVYLGSGTP